MLVVFPAYLKDNKNIDIIRDQLYVVLYSFFRYNKAEVLILTNSDLIEKEIKIFKDFYSYDINVRKIDFNEEWEKLNLYINPIKTRKEFIISKILPIFLIDSDFLMMDWDILNTEEYISKITKTDKIRFFNPKNYDGCTLKQVSFFKGLRPISEDTGNFRWLNSGVVFFKKDITKKLIKEYWDLFNNTIKNEYKGIYLFDIIGDELIYNLMKIDKVEEIEECTAYNINVIPKNFCFYYDSIKDMEIGKIYPYVLNVHFSVGHIKPYNVFIDEDDRLHTEIILEKYNQTRDEIRWCFDISQHKIGSNHYNALIFSIIWQYYRYRILEEMSIIKKEESKKYLNFFKENIIY
jgi:hypothetical protein